MVDKAFLSAKIESLLMMLTEKEGSLRPPIDPLKLLDLCNVLSVEDRPMVPEGVLVPVRGGFKMYLQSNFLRQRGGDLRRRFTIAHELAHTLYYNVTDGLPKPIASAPRGSALEKMCHRLAGQILIPDRLLKESVKNIGLIASAEAIFDLAQLFHVSVEATVRRLHEVERVTDYNFAAVLVDARADGAHSIQAACYGAPLLACRVHPPKRGMSFDAWVAPLIPLTGGPREARWSTTVGSTVVTARRVERSSRSYILDLRLGRAGLA